MSRDYLVALPAYNEIESIGEMIERIRSTGKSVVVIDNNSQDGTAEEAERLGVEVCQRDEYGSGYGCAIRKAMDVALDKGYEYLAFLDCDGTYPPEAFRLMEPFLESHDMIIGARPMKDIDPVRRFGNYVHTYACRILYWNKLQDFNSGMRIIRIDKFKGHVNAYHFGMMAQMTSFALRNKYRIKEVPISYDERLGESKLQFRDGLVILRYLLSERLKNKIPNGKTET